MTSHVDEIPFLGNEQNEQDHDFTEEKVTSSHGFMVFEEEKHKHETQDFKYDVFISYSASDRPWVRDVLLQTLEQEGKKVCIDYRDFQPGVPITDNVVQAIENSQVTILVLTPAFVESEWCMFESKYALNSSLATSRARVLPLILMECDIPNILKHLTYLDHTSKDVQPYFKEQLIDSLKKAKKADSSRFADIMHKYKQSNARTLQQQKLYWADYSFDDFQSNINICCAVGFVLISLVSILLLAILVIARTSIQSTNNLNPVIETPHDTFVGTPLKGPFFDSCQSLHITRKNSDDPLVFSAFGFKGSVENAIYLKEDSIKLNALLSPKRMLKKPSNFHFYGFMWLNAKFCFFSARNASLRLYLPKTAYEAKQFERSSISNPELIFGVEHRDYKSIGNQSFCSTFQFGPKRLVSNKENSFVFYNFGTSSVFLNLTIITILPDYRKSLADRACRKVTKCDISNWKSSKIRILILAKNDTDSQSPALKDCVFHCVSNWKTKYYVIEAVLIIFGFLLTCLVIFINKKCTPRLRKWYFKRDKIRSRYTEWQLSMLNDKEGLEIYLKDWKKKLLD